MVGAAAIPVAIVPAGTAAATSATSAFEIHDASQAPAIARATGAYAAGRSLNWSGYVKPGSGFTSIVGEFRVPTLLTTAAGYSSDWIGLDGASSSDQYLIQTGVEADVIGGRPTYYAWWEVITPTNQAPEVRFTTLTLHPADIIAARIVRGTNGEWTMALTDITTGKSASHVTAFAGRGLSAEWIVEDTDVNGSISPAPDWQAVGFSRLAVNNVNPQLSPAQALDIWSAPGFLGGLLGGSQIQEDSTSAPGTTRDNFSVKWLATGRPTRA